jgi:hypothetical protein
MSIMNLVRGRATLQGLGLAASVYSTGRSLLVPSPLAGVAGSLESTVTSISRPVFHAVQDQSGKVIHCNLSIILVASFDRPSAAADGALHTSWQDTSDLHCMASSIQSCDMVCSRTCKHTDNQLLSCVAGAEGA